MLQRDRGARAQGRFQKLFETGPQFPSSAHTLLMRQAPIEGAQLQKRNFVTCLKSILLLQVNLTSILPSGRLGLAVISSIGKKLGIYCYETIPLGTDSPLFS
jgi:hypothetical protein